MPNQNRVLRKKRNLVRKKMGRKKMDGLVWYIGLYQNTTTFYVTDYDDANHTILWSRRKSNGISFTTERGVHKFISQHLSDRSDIFLIQAPKAG